MSGRTPVIVQFGRWASGAVAILLLLLSCLLVAACTANSGGGAGVPSGAGVPASATVSVVTSAGVTSAGVTSAAGPAGATTSARPGSPSPARTGPLTTGPGVVAGEKPPVMNAAARHRGPVGAIAFAHYYYEALDWSLATTDPRPLEGLNTPSCTFCDQRIDEIRRAGQSGAQVRGGRITVLSAQRETGSFSVKSDYVVAVAIVQTPGKIVDSAGRSTSRIAGGKSSIGVYVTWLAGRWQVIDLGTA